MRFWMALVSLALVCGASGLLHACSSSSTNVSGTGGGDSGGGAGSDASGSTGGVSGGGGGAGGADLDASDASPAFCVSQNPAPWVCIDFDQGNLSNAFINGVASAIAPPDGSDAGASVGLGSNFVSPPASFAVSTPATSTGTVSAYYLYSPTAPPSTGARLRFALRINAYATTADAGATSVSTIARIFLRSGSDFVQAQYYLVGHSILAGVRLSGTKASAPLAAADQKVLVPPMGSFATMELVLTVDPPHLELWRDQNLEASLDITTPMFPSTSSRDFHLGLDTGAPFDPLSIEIDDVTFGAP